MQRKDAPAVKPSKYRNQRCEVLGIMFDSKREAAEYLRLHAREQAGEITKLRRQVSYPLMCPILATPGLNAVVAHYIADFVYEEAGRERIIDAKGVKTQVYAQKKRWLETQNSVCIEEV